MAPVYAAARSSSAITAVPISVVPTFGRALGPDVGGADAAVERRGDRPVEQVGLARPCRRSSGAPWRSTRSWRSGWRCPCRRCPAPSRAPARRAPCACRSSASGAPSEAEGSMPSEPVSIAATSDSMSPKRLSVTITSNCFGARTSCMPPASASMWSSCDVGIRALVDVGHHLVPQHARLHDVPLLHRRHLVPPRAREVEGDAGDALDLVGVVDLRVDGALLAVAEVA